MNYTEMSAHEFVLELAEIVRKAVVKWHAVDMNQVIAIESALRKAVIREASVGTLNIRSERGTRVMVPEAYDHGPFGDRGIANGDYDLIPKETP